MNISFMVASRIPTLVRTALVTALLVGAGLTASATPSSSPPAAAVPVAVQAACPVDPATPKRQFRGMWIASVANVDWPSRTGLSVAEQQAEYRSWLDLAVRNR